MTESVLVESAEDMCRCLQNACQGKALDFARAQHERACWSYDDQRAAFWQDVTALLLSDRDGDGAATLDAHRMQRSRQNEVGAVFEIIDARCMA